MIAMAIRGVRAAAPGPFFPEFFAIGISSQYNANRIVPVVTEVTSRALVNDGNSRPSMQRDAQ
jgi:hypothetical protein